MSEEEKEAIEKLKEYALCKVNDNGYVEVSANGYKHTILNLIENQQKELEHYKRLAEMNLKDSEEFKENMCEHRCILNNQIMELTEELDMQIEHNKELDKILYAKQSMIDELTQNEEQLKIELGKEKENLKIAVAMLTKGTYPEENEGDNDFNKKFIALDKIKELLENEIIDISGFRCIAVEDIENLLEGK